ncbi:nucleoside-diphosphate-sugar epimerase family protein [Rutstroemia sp. NJR-2017a BBW]|nr:nucleoside-diphosphate-sugar epimerase family protein [Rutstroemia sp. NJR-2017a BBW]
MSKTILVTGATGKQGGAAIDALLASPSAKDITIAALTRTPESPAAQKLLQESDKIKLIKGDNSDFAAVFAAVETPITGVFCVTMPNLHLGGGGTNRHGKDSDNDPTDVPHFISKAKVEDYLKEKCEGSNMSWTILRPVAFMENFTTGIGGKIFPTAWCAALSPTTKLQLVATADIGYFAAQAFLHPQEYKGRAISIAGDELTFGEANEIFQSRLGKDIPRTFGFVGSTLLWAIKDVGLMFQWFEKRGYAADIEGLRKEHPGLQSFGDWLKTSGL